MRSKIGKYKTPYSKRIIISYLQSVSKLIGKSPTFRDLNVIPGPSSRTIIRHFGKWVNALKKAGLRPQTNQLMKGERGFIRQNWRKMTDEQIANKLGLTESIVKYYRMQFNLWKNRKGTSDQKHKKDGQRVYGKNCEICNVSITELHHIKPKSQSIKDWAILCPNCHAVITRKMIQVNKRGELLTKLKPFMEIIYKDLNLRR